MGIYDVIDGPGRGHYMVFWKFRPNMTSLAPYGLHDIKNPVGVESGPPPLLVGHVSVKVGKGRLPVPVPGLCETQISDEMNLMISTWSRIETWIKCWDTNYYWWLLCAWDVYLHTHRPTTTWLWMHLQWTWVCTMRVCVLVVVSCWRPMYFLLTTSYKTQVCVELY